MSNRLHQQSFTMDDIARKLGISKSTVSRALAGSKRISAETRARVEECAHRNGFIPNLAAKALAKQLTLNIAAVMPSEATNVEMMFFHECLNGMVAKSAASDYSVLVCMDGAAGGSLLAKVVSNRKVDGVVLMQFRRGDENIEVLRKSGIPFVVIGSGVKDGLVCVDSRMTESCTRFTAECVRRCDLVERGRVLFVCGSLDIEANNNRLLGFLGGMEKTCSNDVQYAICTYLDDMDTSVFDNHWNLILCSDDVVCVRVLSVLKAIGIEAGRDVRIASFHDSVLLASNDPPVSALKVDAFGLGERAAETALRMISGDDVEECTFVGCSFEFRGTA